MVLMCRIRVYSYSYTYAQETEKSLTCGVWQMHSADARKDTPAGRRDGLQFSRLLSISPHSCTVHSTYCRCTVLFEYLARQREAEMDLSVISPFIYIARLALFRR